MEQRSDPVIFINYRRSDAGWPADRLAERLRTAFGNDRVFLDVRSVEAGEDHSWKEKRDTLENAASNEGGFTLSEFLAWFEADDTEGEA